MNWYLYACISALVFVKLMFSETYLSILLVLDGTPQALVLKLALLGISLVVGFIAYVFLVELKKWWKS